MTDKQIIERLKTDLDFERSKRKTLQSELTAKEQKLQEAMDNYVKLDNQRVKEYNELVDLYKAKEQECEELKKLLKVRIEDLCDSCGASSMMPMPCKVYEKTLTEIKELLLKTPTDSQVHCVNAKSVILQKISEVLE